MNKKHEIMVWEIILWAALGTVLGLLLIAT